MKELSIEEKAKAYDKAIERAKKWYNAPNVDKIPTFGNRVIEEIFPELKESEDERIGKDLIIYLRSILSNKKYGDKFIESWIAWLEKQGKQKPINSQFTPEQAGVLDKHIDKFLEQNPWSEEDEKYTNIVLAALYSPSAEGLYSFHNVKSNDVTNWFISLKDRVQPQPKQEWSVDDERVYRSVLYDFEHHFPLNCVQQEFVKSHIQPQNRWKPTKQQLSELRCVISGCSFETSILVELEENLKKLL